jgi:hypothetical protein
MNKRISTHDRYVALRDELAEFKSEHGLPVGKTTKSDVAQMDGADQAEYARLQRVYLKAFKANKWEMGRGGKRK